MIKVATKGDCECPPSEKNIVRVTSRDIRPHELEDLDVFYCVTCNNTWDEA